MSCDLLEAAVLVGGRGTRLHGVVNDRPKPMADVAGRPFLEWLLLVLRRQAVGRVVLCTGYMSDAIEAHFGDGSRWDLTVVYSRERQPLGTAGAIRRALSLMTSERFLALNGDSYCPFDVLRLEDQHVRCQSAATMWLVWEDDCRRFGSVLVDEAGAVTAFREKSHQRRAGLINAGVYLLERSTVKSIPPGENVSMETAVLPALVGKGLHAVAGDGPFLDIGTPESYAAAQEFFSPELLR